MNLTEPLWDKARVAQYLGVPVGTVEMWRHRHKGPPAFRVGRHLRYDPDDVREWVLNLPERA